MQKLSIAIWLAITAYSASSRVEPPATCTGIPNEPCTYYLKGVDETIYAYSVDVSIREDNNINVGFVIPENTNFAIGYGVYMTTSVMYSCSYVNTGGICRKYWSASHARPTRNERAGSYNFTAVPLATKD